MPEERNLYDLRPVPLVEGEPAADGRVVLRVPRFRARFMVRFLVPRLKRPWYRVHLDELGSLVWKECTGRSTVLEIAGRVHAAAGGDREALDRRVAEFMRRLDREGFIRLDV